MARGFIRKPSFWKIVSAYRSQWKRSLMRWLFPNTYGKKGMGWWTNPRKAVYNWWYRRTSVSLYDLGLFRRTRPSSFLVECAIGVGLLCSLFLLPIDVPVAASTGRKIQKQRFKRADAKRQREAAAKQKAEREHAQRKTVSHASTWEGKSSAVSKSNISKPIAEEEKTPPVYKDTEQRTPRKEQENASSVSYKPVISTKPVELPKPQAAAEPDENTPKSKPKHEGDRYIRKRMIIAGTSYCDQNVIAKLTIGTYFDLVAEPNNPYDKNAIMLTLKGETIGYVAKNDRTAFVTCLKLRRPVYGVVTDIRNLDGRKQVEYETWFEQP